MSRSDANRPTPTDPVLRAGPPAYVGGVLGRVAASAYGAIVARRNRRFDAGKGVRRLDRPVISVGNISVGGTGKSPMVAWIARALREDGFRPCIATRGYGTADPGQADEVLEYRHALPDVPVVAHPDRHRALSAYFAGGNAGPTNVVVLDDGFQHRRLARDLDIVLLDATRDPWRDELLPRGSLREPVESLRRAQALVVTHAEVAPEADVLRVRAMCEALNPAASVAVARHAWTSLAVHEGARFRIEPVDWLRAREALGVCALGNPGPFIAAVAGAAARPPAAMTLPDHDPFELRTIERIAGRARDARAGVIVMTAKDWVKARRAPADLWPCPVAVPALELRFDGPGELGLRARLQRAASGTPG